MPKVYVENVGMTAFGKKNETLLELVLEAVENLVNNRYKHRFDAIFIGSMNPDELNGLSNISARIVDYLGFVPVPAVRVETAMSTGASVFEHAFFAVASRIHERVLVIAAEKMTHLPTPIVSKILAKVIDDNERLYGATMPALAALVTRRYMYDFDLSRDELSKVAVKNHYNGSLNPYAQFQKPISLDEVNSSRIVADPLRLYDCSPVSDGACALILTSKKTDVKVLGIGHGTDFLALQHRTTLTSFNATKVAARNAYEMAKIIPKDINVAELHDAFTSFEIISSEDVEFFRKGEGGKALVKGETALNGRLPINPSGGLKARGHPIGASGLAQIIELVWQLRREAGKRQVDDARTGLAQSTGGLGNNNIVTILGVV